MTNTEELSALNPALATTRARYEQLMNDADQILEKNRNEHRRRIAESARKVASLEHQLEIFEAFERDLDAARLRMEIAKALEEHQKIVDEAIVSPAPEKRG